MQTQEEILESIKRRKEIKDDEFNSLLSAKFPLKEWQYVVLNHYVTKFGEDENVKMFIDQVYNSRDGAVIYDFAYNYIRPDFSKLSKAMAKTKEGDYIVRFSLDFGDADQEVLTHGLCECGDEYWQLKALFENTKLDKTQQEDLVESVLSKYNNVKIAHIINNRLGKNGELDKDLRRIFSYKLMENPNYYFVKKCATSLPLSMDYISGKIDTCFVPIHPELKPQDFILDFAKTVPNANMSMLTELMIKYSDVKYLYAFATECEGANLKAIAREITRNHWLTIKGIAYDDVNYRAGVVPDFDKNKYQDETEYHEDLLIKLKKYKQTPQYAIRKKEQNENKKDDKYDARIMSL